MRCNKEQGDKLGVACRVHFVHYECLGKGMDEYICGDGCEECKFNHINLHDRENCGNCGEKIGNRTECLIFKTFCMSCRGRFLDNSHFTNCQYCNSLFEFCSKTQTFSQKTSPQVENFYEDFEMSKVNPSKTINFQSQNSFMEVDKPVNRTQSLYSSSKNLKFPALDLLSKKESSNFSLSLDEAQFKRKYKGIILSDSRSITSFTTYCTSCHQESDIAFQCNHNHCYKCIFNQLINKLTGFIYLANNNRVEEIENQFKLLCLSKGCNEAIQVPSKMMLEYQMGELERYILTEFIPYFDGIKTKFSICKCGFLLGSISKIKMNCYCDRNLPYF